MANTNRYAEVCQAMSARFRLARDPDVVMWTGWAATLAPGSGVDFSQLLDQLRQAAARTSGPHAAAYRFYIAAALLRSGAQDEAIGELNAVCEHLKVAGGFVSFPAVYPDLMLAICEAHKGDLTSAQKHLGLVPSASQGALAQGIPSPPGWSIRFVFSLLQKEAYQALAAP